MGMTDTTPLLTVIEDVYTAWAANDAEAFVSHYAEEATATLPGTLLDGREAIRASMAASFAGELKGTKGVFRLHSARQLADGKAAVVNTTSNLVPAGGTNPIPGGWARDTWTLSLHDGAWCVDAYHSAPVA
jgi:uncharacterized protein (TIGR02246 family)